MKFRSFILAVLLAGASFQASAQMAVIDPAVLAQTVKQVTAWKQQLDYMQNQIKAMTGDRGMGGVLGTVAPSMPSNWVDAMRGVSSLAQEIRAAQAVLPPAVVAQLAPDLRSLLEQAQNLSASTQAMTQTAYNAAATGHVTRIASLKAQLANTTDMKAAADLQNLVGIEQASLINEQNQINAANASAAAQAQAQRLMINQMRASTAGTGEPFKIDFSLP